MLYLIITACYFALPAYLANMAPVIFARLGLLKSLARPIDAGRKLGRQFIFGAGKTWRGIVAGVIAGIAIAGLQGWLYRYDFFRDISLLDYPREFLWFGLLAGLGALLGDLVKSFFKRRAGIASGRPWPVFDQLDFIAGFLALTYWLAAPPAGIIITIFLLTLILHPLVNISAYWLRIKKVWW